MSEEMSKRELALFNLGKSLVELLGEELAIANLTLLYQRHPEMFVDEEELKRVIQKVVSSPDIIVKNPKAKSDKDFLVIKQLDHKKVGDIAIRNDNGTNIIFHANKKNISKINVEKLKEQMLVETPSAQAAPTRLDHCADKPNDLSKDCKAPSTPAISIIPHTKQQPQQELDKQLKSYLTAPSKHHRERHLANANAIAIKAKDNNIALDSASLQKLKQYNNNEKNLSKSKGLHK